MTLSNGQVHERLRARYGPARDHLCPCGKQAEEWAYQHTAETELSPGNMPYSESDDDYLPMCRSCHRRLDRESYRANGRERGRYAGALTAARMAADPEYRSRITLNLGEHLEKMKTDPEYRARYSSHMRRTNLRRWRCTECGYENNAGNLGWHAKKAGHAHREEVMPDV